MLKSSDPNVFTMADAKKTPIDEINETIRDLDTPIVDAIDKAMRYAIELVLEQAAQTAPQSVERLHSLTTLAARGAVLRALREEREKVAADALSTPPSHPISQNAFIREVIKFNMIAGRSMDQFNPRAIALHTAFQLEELGEKLELGLLAGWTAYQLDTDIMTLVNGLVNMKHLGAIMKAGKLDYLFDKADPVELLDGDLDVMVVSIGSMMSQGADIFGAAHAVSEANLAKFPGGMCIKDKDGKIQKPDGWKPADLTPYLHISKRPARMTDDPARFVQGDLGVTHEDEMNATLDEKVPATVTGTDGVARPNPAAGAPNVPGYDPKG